MNKIVHLSITKKEVPTRIDVVQFATRPSIVFVLDDYIPASGARASFYIQKPDGTKIYNTCTISGNNITYNPTTQSFAALGTNKCQLQIIESGNTAVTFLIYADVTENIIDSSAVESTDEFTALEEALQEVESLMSRINGIERGILTSGTDLNTIINMGVYNVLDNAAPTLVNGPPVTSGGVLEIFRTSSNGKIVQIYYRNNGIIYYRVYTTIAWTLWKTLPYSTGASESFINASNDYPLSIRFVSDDFNVGLFGRNRSLLLYNNAISESLCEVFDTRYIQAQNGANFNLANSLTKIPMVQATRVGGNRGFIIENGEIVCQSNGTIEIYAGLTANGFTAGDRIALQIFRLRENNESSISFVHYTTAGGNQESIILTPMSTSIQSGDRIYAKAYNSTAARGVISTNACKLSCKYISIS